MYSITFISVILFTSRETSSMCIEMRFVAFNIVDVFFLCYSTSLFFFIVGETSNLTQYLFMLNGLTVWMLENDEKHFRFHFLSIQVTILFLSLAQFNSFVYNFNALSVRHTKALLVKISSIKYPHEKRFIKSRTIISWLRGYAQALKQQVLHHHIFFSLSRSCLARPNSLHLYSVSQLNVVYCTRQKAFCHLFGRFSLAFGFYLMFLLCFFSVLRPFQCQNFSHTLL